MRCHRLRALWLVPLVLLPMTANSSPAGILFGKKKQRPPTPAERVPALLAQVKSDGDESKRAAAAQELRQYDPARYPMIVPVLVDVLLTDKKPSVRVEAAQSLGKIRPVTQQAGVALEHALNRDASMRVRLQARSSLLQYHWAGYHGTRTDEMITQTKEPPLADAATPPAIQTMPQAPPRGRLVPRQADGSRSSSSYRPTAPATFPPAYAPPTVKEPPLAAPTPPAIPTPPVAAPTTPAGKADEPELTPP